MARLSAGNVHHLLNASLRQNETREMELDSKQTTFLSRSCELNCSEKFVQLYTQRGLTCQFILLCQLGYQGFI